MVRGAHRSKAFKAVGVGRMEVMRAVSYKFFGTVKFLYLADQ